MTPIDAISFGLGLLGSVLGVLNTWRAFDKDRVKLRVIPKISFAIGGGNSVAIMPDTAQFRDLLDAGVPNRLTIDVVNLSSFPVTISEVGFGRMKGARHVFHPTVTGVGDKTFPTRLESREAASFHTATGAQLNPKQMTKATAYAETDCGFIGFGKSPAFSAYVDRLRGTG